jgi:hypothetical protein
MQRSLQTFDEGNETYSVGLSSLADFLHANGIAVTPLARNRKVMPGKYIMSLFLSGSPLL